MAHSLNQTRRLAAALIVSGALNVFLLVLIFYWAEQERSLVSFCGQRVIPEQAQHVPLATTHHSNSEVIRTFRKMSFTQLKANLLNAQPVEEGYTQRDLALASLVTFHHFDLSRALSGYPHVQPRRLAYGKYRDGRIAEVTVYAGLSESQYAQVVDFATTERWPLTSKGLFTALKKQHEKGASKEDPSLADAFFMTQEFSAVEALFGYSAHSVERNELLDAILQGEWTTLANFFGQQRVLQDLSITRRQSFLLDYVKLGSKAAAYLMLKSDGDFALRRLNDAQVIQLLQLLDDKRAESEHFALALLTSSRTEEVWLAATKRLYEYAGEVMPEKFHHHAALAKFVRQNAVVRATEYVSHANTNTNPKTKIEPSTPALAPTVTLKSSPTSMAVASVTPKANVKSPSKSNTIASSNKDSLYIVQEGDSLWKISRRFNVNIDCLKSHNRLESDLLKPGKPLRIPKS